MAGFVLLFIVLVIFAFLGPLSSAASFLWRHQPSGLWTIIVIVVLVVGSSLMSRTRWWRQANRDADIADLLKRLHSTGQTERAAASRALDAYSDESVQRHMTQLLLSSQDIWLRAYAASYIWKHAPELYRLHHEHVIDAHLEIARKPQRGWDNWDYHQDLDLWRSALDHLGSIRERKALDSLEKHLDAGLISHDWDRETTKAIYRIEDPGPNGKIPRAFVAACRSGGFIEDYLPLVKDQPLILEQGLGAAVGSRRISSTLIDLVGIGATEAAIPALLSLNDGSNTGIAMRAVEKILARRGPSIDADVLRRLAEVGDGVVIWRNQNDDTVVSEISFESLRDAARKELDRRRAGSAGMPE